MMYPLYYIKKSLHLYNKSVDILGKADIIKRENILVNDYTLI